MSSKGTVTTLVLTLTAGTNICREEKAPKGALRPQPTTLVGYNYTLP